MMVLMRKSWEEHVHVCFTAYIVDEVRNWFAKVQMIWQQPIKSYKRPHGLSHVLVSSLRVRLYFFERRAVASAEMLVSKSTGTTFKPYCICHYLMLDVRFESV